MDKILSLVAGLKTQLIIAGVVAAVLAGLYFYISYLNGRIDTLKTEKTTLELQVESQKTIITSLETTMAKNQKAIDVLSKRYSAVNKKNAQLLKQYNTTKIISGDVSVAQNSINDLSRKLFFEFEEITLIDSYDISKDTK